MPERTLIVKPIGLVTQPNKMGQFPDGALSQAKDFITRAPGLFQQAYSKTSSWSTSGQPPQLLSSTANQLIALHRNAGVWGVSWLSHALTSPTSTFGTLPYATDDFSQTGRLQAITMRGRTVINGSTKNAIVADYENPSSSAERTFRLTGLMQPQLLIAAVSTSVNAQALAPNTIATYATLHRRVFSDGYELSSRPSLVVRIANNTGTPANPEIYIKFEAAEAKAGDIVELYRSQALPFTGPEDPGSTLYQVASHVLTSAEALGGLYNFIDTALASSVGDPLNGLGRDLYTNPGLGGLSNVNDPPPVAACTAIFRGRAFYGNCRFPARLNLSIRTPYGSLVTDSERLNGIGLRVVQGTFSNGSATVTGVSASDILGLAPGQSVGSSKVPPGTARILSVGANSYVMTVNANASGVESTPIFDLIELDGTFVTATNLFSDSFMRSYKVTASRTLHSTSFSTETVNGVDISIERQRYVPPATLTVRATSGAKYDPTLPLLSDPVRTIQPTQSKNVIRWSHDQQPEAVPPTNEAYVGNGELYVLIATRDALWGSCSDGLYRISGNIAPIDGIPDIRIDLIDSTLVIAGPRAWCVLRDRIFAYTNRGFVAISDDGIVELSTGVIGDLLPGTGWNEAKTPFLVADERTDEIYIVGAHASLNFVYSLRYGCFTTTSQFNGALTGVQLATSLALVFGYGTLLLDELQPDLTDLLTTGPVIDFQPAFGNRPDTIKQWVDATFIMETGSSGTLDPRFNGASALGESLVALGNDLRASVGVPCDAPAIGPSLAPGFAVLSAGLKKLSGISLRYVTTTEQQGVR